MARSPILGVEPPSFHAELVALAASVDAVFAPASAMWKCAAVGGECRCEGLPELGSVRLSISVDCRVGSVFGSPAAVNTP